MREIVLTNNNISLNLSRQGYCAKRLGPRAGDNIPTNWDMLRPRKTHLIRKTHDRQAKQWLYYYPSTKQGIAKSLNSEF